MKTKRAFLLFFTGLIALAARAQDSKCEDSFKAFEVKAKSAAWNDAALLLPELRKKCPKYDARLYDYGEKVLGHKVASVTAEADKKAAMQDLSALYDEQEKNFPGTGGVVKKALLLSEKQLAKDDEVFKILEGAFVAHKQAFTDYRAFELYFNLYLKRFEEGDKGITPDQFIQKYSDMAAQAALAKNTVIKKREAILAKQETQLPEAEDRQYLADTKSTAKILDAVISNMTKQASKYFNCDKLEALYSAGYEKNKGDAAWLEAMVNVLYSNKCYKSGTLYNGAVALHKLQPTYGSAAMLAYLSQKRNSIKEAIAYYEQAATLQADPLKKAGIYTTIATIYRNGDMAKAKEYALQSAGLNPKSGKPYLLLAEMYSSGADDCNLSDFDRRALLWLALDTLKKAEAAEPKYKATVVSLTQEYSKNLPTAKEVKAAKKKAGDTIAYNCWINETVTIPRLK